MEFKIFFLVIYLTDALSLREDRKLGRTRIHDTKTLNILNDFQGRFDWKRIHKDLKSARNMVKDQHIYHEALPYHFEGSNNPRRCSVHNVSQMHEECTQENLEIFRVRNDRDIKVLRDWMKGEGKDHSKVLVRLGAFKKLVLGDEILSGILVPVKESPKHVEFMYFVNQTYVSPEISKAEKTLCCTDVISSNITQTQTMLDRLVTGVENSLDRLDDEFVALSDLDEVHLGRENVTLRWRSCQKLFMLLEKSCISGHFMSVNEMEYLESLNQGLDDCYDEVTFKTIDILEPKGSRLSDITEVLGRNGRHLIVTGDYSTSYVHHYKINQSYEKRILDFPGQPIIRYATNQRGEVFGVLKSSQHLCTSNSGMFSCRGSALGSCQLDLNEPDIIEERTGPMSIRFRVQRVGYDSCLGSSFNLRGKDDERVVHNIYHDKNVTVEIRCTGTTETIVLGPREGILHECPVHELRGLSKFFRADIHEAVKNKYQSFRTWLDTMWFKAGLTTTTAFSLLLMFYSYCVRQKQYKKLKERIEKTSEEFQEGIDGIGNNIDDKLSAGLLRMINEAGSRVRGIES